MFSGRQVEEESTLSSQYTALKDDSQASFSNKLAISNKTNPRFLMAKNSFANNSNLTINIDKSATFSIQKMKRVSKQISRKSKFFKAELTYNEPQEKFLPAMLARTMPQKSLSSLTLKFSHENPKARIFKNLALGLPNLCKLDISFTPNSKITAEFLGDLSLSLTYFPHLTELGLNISGLALSNNDFLILAKKIQRFSKNFRQLKLNLSKSKNLSAAGIEELGKSLLKLEKLSSLELNLSECPLLEDQDIEQLFANLKTAKNLTSLALALKAPKKLTQRSLKLLLGHENKKEEGSFTLGIVMLGSEIKLAPYEPSSFSQLKKLRLDLSDWDKGKPMGLDLGGAFRSFPNLKVLDLKIGENKMLNERDLTDICLNLIRLKALSKLHLNLSAADKNLTSEAITNLGRALQALTLEDLKLDLSKCVELKSATWSGLFEDLGSLEGLTNLSLNFMECKGICQQEFQQLALSLKEMTSLICLDLNFSFCNLPAPALQSLASVLKNVQNLQFFTIAVDGNPTLISKDFYFMTSGFREAPSLKEINLKVDASFFKESGFYPRNPIVYCIAQVKSLRCVKLESTSISEDQLLALSDFLTDLEHVPCIKLHFSGSRGISPKTKAVFGANIRKVKGLKEFELVINGNWLDFVFEDFNRIEWNLKDLQSAVEDDQIARFEKASKREKRNNACKVFLFVLLNIGAGALGFFAAYAIDHATGGN